MMVEILVKATLMASAELGGDDPVCITFSSKNDSAAANIYQGWLGVFLCASGHDQLPSTLPALRGFLQLLKR